MLGFNEKHISAREQEADPGLISMKSAVENAKENNPFVVYEATGNDLVYAIFDIAKNADGVHLEKALGIAGALAGYSCAIVSGLLAESHTDATNATQPDGLLLHANTSIYRVLVGKAAVLDAPSALDLGELSARHGNQIGTPGFGIPQMPKGRQLDELPLTFVLDYWQEMIGIMTRYDAHFAGWPLSWAAACAQLMEMGQSVMPPQDALKIMMECAMPMSRIGPANMGERPPSQAA